MSGVVGDDERRAACQSQLEHQIILGVGQMGPPQKMDPALDALRQEVVEEVIDVLWRVAGEQSGPAKDIFILQAEWR